MLQLRIRIPCYLEKNSSALNKLEIPRHSYGHGHAPSYYENLALPCRDSSLGNGFKYTALDRDLFPRTTPAPMPPMR